MSDGNRTHAVSPADIELVGVLHLTESERWKLREFRNHPRIRNRMYTDHKITRQEHAGWLHSLAASRDDIVFGVRISGELAGMAAFKNFSSRHRRADWAFYLHPSSQGSGAGAALEFKMLERFFYIMGGEKLNCEVLENNKRVVRFHERFGFRREGFRRAHIQRSGRRLGAQLLGITRSEWGEARREWAGKLAVDT